MTCDEDDEAPEPCEGCGAPSVLTDVNLLPLCRACADGCKYAPDAGEMVH